MEAWWIGPDGSVQDGFWYEGLTVAPHISLRAVQNDQGRFIEADGDSFMPNGDVALSYDISSGGAPDTHQTGEQNAKADGQGGLRALLKVNLSEISGANVNAVDIASNRSATASL
jgi:hypothetical protein